jgi:hypothetical protein
MGLTGTLQLDAEGNPDAVWIFQVGSALTTAPSSTVSFVNGVGRACNVFWQVTSNATIDTNTTFVGTILALTSIWVATGASIDGRALARNGEVTLDNNRITQSDCAAVSPPPSASPSPSPSATPTTAPSSTPTSSGAPNASAAPTASAAVPDVPAVVIAPGSTPTVNGPRMVVPVPPRITLPPTDTAPLTPGPGTTSNFGWVLMTLGGLLILAAVIFRGKTKHARR